MAVAPGSWSLENLGRTVLGPQPGAMASAAMSTNEPAGNKTPAHDRVAEFRQAIIDTLDDQEQFSRETLLENIGLEIGRREVCVDARGESNEMEEVLHCEIRTIDGSYETSVSAVGNAVLTVARERSNCSHPDVAGTAKRYLRLTLPLEVLDG